MALKDSIRKSAGRARAALAQKDILSLQITDRIIAMPEYGSAQTILWYVDVRDEVRTRHVLPDQIALGKQIAVPYCDGDSLRLFRLTEMAELEFGSFGILEPRVELRSSVAQRVDPLELDLVVVPGVGFDTSGGRIGHGRGFYDRLLAAVGQSTLLVAAGFECQIVPTVPMSSHDVPMDWLVTETRLIQCNRLPRVHADP